MDTHIKQDIILYYCYKFIRTIGFVLSHTFVPIYLFSDLGYSIFQTALTITLIHFFMLPFISYTNKVIEYIGVKKTISLHIFGMSVFFYGLQYLSGDFIADLFFIFCLAIVKSIPKAFYSVADTIFMNERILKYKTEFGRKLSHIHILLILAGITAPVIGGALAYFYGFSNFFTVVSLFTLLGAIPLFIGPDFKTQFISNNKQVIHFIYNKLDKSFKLGIIGHSFSDSILQIIWPIFIIIVVGNTLDVGYILSISALISILISKLIGKILDKNDFEKGFSISIILASIIFFSRVLFPHPILLSITDALNKVIHPVVNIPFDKYLYEYIHTFKNKSFVSTCYVFCFEFVYLIGFLGITIYFGMIELLEISYNYLVFIILFILYGLSILLIKKIAYIQEK